MPIPFQDEDRDETIYSYDENGVFVGSYTKRIPRGVGLPRNAWNVAPPALGANEAARFNRDNETWEVVPDFRGAVRYTPEGERIEINDVGPMPPGLLEDKPIPPGQARKDRDALVRKHLDDTAEAQGFDSMLDAVSYADEPTDPARQALGAALRAWRSTVMLRVDAAPPNQPGPALINSLPDFTP